MSTYSVICQPFANFPTIELSFDTEYELKVYCTTWFNDPVSIWYAKDGKEFFPLWGDYKYRG